MPPVGLRSTYGRQANVAEISKGRAVFFFYPRTGKPGTPVPRGWDEIPGARGCTPQNCAFRDAYQEFKRLHFRVFGVSEQSLEEQMEFAKRENLPYELLNDCDFELTKALRLPTFQFQGKTFVKRLALVVLRRQIERVFYPIFPPDKNAEEVLAYLHTRQERDLRYSLKASNRIVQR